ncbi:type VI secretion system tip protein TssI/VgrG [Paucibacter sp. R3-3]|uniref:Type VI secretion system tip protein TssI/VgrG n=1 Tax=Roseateles agri TaxID=3098619 RepID=A0ABU5DIJ7_9BURK|nr:type VI secretion system tip protein TssI/VgrG [Paucibacter sp. R3-3]MDY0745974.1 type VI secretion system tip protein TssI/VgrG [Paucibacter sp. R3-3]
MANELEAEFLTPLDGEEPALLFRVLDAREELGRLPEYRLELLRESDREVLAPDDVLGAQVDIKIMCAEDKYRYINGFITRFERGGVAGRHDIYRVEVTPWLWQLTLGSDCKIFQDKTAVEVIEAVFADYSNAGAVKKDQLTAGSAKRPFTVQYNESDYNFVTRLMEEEGIYFYFTHKKGSHTLVLTDKASGHDPIKGDTLHWGTTRTGDSVSVDVITDWTCTHAVGSTKYTHTDYAAEKPTLDLKTEATRSPSYSKHPKNLEVFEYPGDYTDVSMDEQPDPKKTVGANRAQMRVDRFESGRVIAVGITPYRWTSAGATFSLDKHPVDNGDYLITVADFTMTFSHYEAKDSEVKTGFACRFEAVPKAAPYRPQPIAFKPIIYGPQTATVVGASGDEITTDKYARAKLQFRWDRLGTKDDKSSCWVRVSQPWAGKQFGMIALPRIGDEVVVEFLEGNPDRPLITGRVYNGDNMPPYTLPAQATVSGIKTQSSKKGSLSNANELRFDDKKGSEYVWFQAEKDMHRWVKNDSFSSVLNNYWGDVTKNWSLKIGGTADLAITDVTKVKIDKDTSIGLGADLHMKVGAAMGLDITGALNLKGADKIAVTSGQGTDLKVGQGLKVSATAAVSIEGQSIVISGKTQLTLMVGGSTVVLGPAGVTIDGPMVKINCGGSGGSATPAADASPPAPTDPAEPTKNKDPLPAADGGSGANA